MAVREKLSGRERLNKMIDHFAYGNASAFARRIGVDKSVISNIRSGASSFDRHIPRLLEAFPNVREEWLRTGAGDMVVNREWTVADYVRRVEELEEQVRILTRQLKDNQLTIKGLRNKLKKVSDQAE